MSRLAAKILTGLLLVGSYQLISWWLIRLEPKNLYRNSEAVFGLVSRPPAMAAVVFIAVLLLIKLFQSRSGPLGHWGLMLVLSGGLSNLLDRIIHDGVIDYLRLGQWSTFNLADISIVVGAALIALAKPPLKPPAAPPPSLGEREP